jgi:hypothetical protein
MKLTTLRSLALACGLAAIAFGSTQLLAGKPGGGGCPTGKPNCACPQYIDPVVCPDGCTYYNGCAAICAGERNCVRTGGGPVQ